MTSQALYVGIVLALASWLSDRQSELTIQDILDAHHTNSDSVAFIKARVRTTFHGKESHLTELNQEYVYVKQGKHERFTKRLTSPRIVEGEFSRLRFELGRLDIHNGPTGYMRLSGFDGQLDTKSMVPADSPASGAIGPARRSVEYHWIPYHLGLELLCPDDSATAPLRTLYQQANHFSLVERPTKDNQFCFVIHIEMPKGSHRVWLSPEHNFAIRRMDWFGKQEISLQVEDFHHREGVFICKSWKARQVAENGYAVSMDGVVELSSLNQPIPDEDLYVTFPAGLPFTDQHIGQSGIWGEGEPERMFQSDNEARDWNTNRRMAYTPESRKDWGELGAFRKAALIVIGVLFLAGCSWYLYRC